MSFSSTADIEEDSGYEYMDEGKGVGLEILDGKFVVDDEILEAPIEVVSVVTAPTKDLEAEAAVDT